jgi:hypothetical protein
VTCQRLRSFISTRPRLKAIFLPIVVEWGRIRFAWRKLSVPLSQELFLNGQDRRRECFDAVIDAVQPVEIIETGTYRGATTQYLATQYKLPVYTVEANKYFYLYSKLRLLRFRRIHVCFGDSHRWITRRTQNKRPATGPVFFYLDAHWGSNIPLRSEVHTILKHWPEAVICIDDFRVDDDPGYRFDRYGEITLCFDYLEIPSDSRAKVYFPAVPSDSETGLKRGAIWLVIGPTVQERIQTCVPQSLRNAFE